MSHVSEIAEHICNCTENGGTCNCDPCNCGSATQNEQQTRADEVDHDHESVAPHSLDESTGH